MQCEMEYCIYNKEFSCIFDEIQINPLGMCEACEIVTIPVETLNKNKTIRLKEIERTWGNNDE